MGGGGGGGLGIGPRSTSPKVHTAPELWWGCDGRADSSSRRRHTRRHATAACHAACVDHDVKVAVKLQALVYDIFPSTTAGVDYAIGLEKLSANEQFFDDAPTAVSL